MVQYAWISGLTAALLALFLSAPIAVPAEMRTQSFMKVGAVTSQPIGHYEFCRTYKSECNIRTRPAAPPHVTDAGWQVIRDINTAVNLTIKPVTDLELYGKDEVWAYPVTAGDCEDFVLLKRKKLMERGFSPADLLVTVVRKPDGEGHAVLTLRTSAGDFILDNLEDAVKPWTDTPYRYLKRQASFNTGKWVSIENGAEVLVGSVGN
ncbi:transglutaminase-like cysteine peptidase [Rhizobium sp. CFBP 8762]|uniref:transglutaminase-like cysteine peptidase n=1 Tax=Rhizobium sp. CFBP 8762 TaxID=2775279 RepID=UPI001780BB06|nr:transglutaminase-like cysteine peptidase [Rhizobium sp. CFBP 8762]MBD8553793.1 transglutaminase-like cysteine peptidase [Rhizobium sp. CFBP 8762]